MLLRTFSLGLVFLTAATAVEGYQESGARRPGGVTVPARPSVTASRTGVRATYFPAGSPAAASDSGNSASKSSAAAGEGVATAGLKQATGQSAAKAPSPGRVTQAGHVSESPTGARGTVSPVSHVERGSDVDAGFEAYLNESSGNEPAATERRSAPERSRNTAARSGSRAAPPAELRVKNRTTVTKADVGMELDEPTPDEPGRMESGRISPAQRLADHEQAPEGSQSPSIQLEWVSRGEFNAGRETTLELQVRNSGRTAVSGVLTEVTAPGACEFREIVPRPRTSDGVMSWVLGEMQPGEVRSIVFQLTPRQPGDARMTAAVQITGSSAFSFSIREPKLELVLEGPDTAEVGQAAGYLMRVSNPGTGTAENVVIRAQIPEGLEHRSGDSLQIDIGTLNPGESRQAKLNLSTVRGGLFTVDVRAEAEGGLLQEATAEIAVSEPRLLAEIQGPESEMTGRTSDYRLQISNSGSVPSVNVRARYRVPEGFEFVSANRGGRYSKADSSIEWFVGTLQPDETSEFQLTLKPIRTGTATHQAGAISELGQVTTCEHSTSVEGTANLELHVEGKERRLRAGEACVREIRITNSGSQAAKGVGISCELPAGLELLDVDGPSEYIAENGVLVFRSLPEIAAGSEAVYSIRLKCVRSGDHRLRLRIASGSITEPLIGEETIRVAD